jgi:hypothetical protein
MDRARRSLRDNFRRSTLGTPRGGAEPLLSDMEAFIPTSFARTVQPDVPCGSLGPPTEAVAVQGSSLGRHRCRRALMQEACDLTFSSVCLPSYALPSLPSFTQLPIHLGGPAAKKLAITDQLAHVPVHSWCPHPACA